LPYERNDPKKDWEKIGGKKERILETNLSQSLFPEAKNNLIKNKYAHCPHNYFFFFNKWSKVTSNHTP
jgi:hypothetical protein